MDIPELIVLLRQRIPANDARMKIVEAWESGVPAVPPTGGMARELFGRQRVLAFLIEGMAADPAVPPQLVLSATDELAYGAIEQYRQTCLAYGLTETFQEVGKLLEEMRAWRAAHLDLVHEPSYVHVPAVPLIEEQV